MFPPARYLAVMATLLVVLGTATAGPIADPLGDTYGTPVPGLDIVNSPGFVSVMGDYQFTINFAGPISAPSLLAPNSVAGFVDLDLDRNPLTGSVPLSTLVPDPLNLGIEAFINLFDELTTPGFVGLYDPNTLAQLGVLAITYGTDSFTLTLPASLIGNVSSFDYAFVSVPLSGDGLDRVPNGSTPLTVPEPATLVAFGLMLGGAVAARRRKSAVAA